MKAAMSALLTRPSASAGDHRHRLSTSCRRHRCPRSRRHCRLVAVITVIVAVDDAVAVAVAVAITATTILASS